jgi:hypothetical protein
MDGCGQITSPGFWSTPVRGHGMDVNGGRFTPMGAKTPVSVCKHEPPQAKPPQDPPKEVRPTPRPGMAVHIGNAGPQAAHVPTVPPGPAPPQGAHATNCPTEGSNFTLPTGHFESGIGANETSQAAWAKAHQRNSSTAWAHNAHLRDNTATDGDNMGNQQPVRDGFHQDGQGMQSAPRSQY